MRYMSSSSPRLGLAHRNTSQSAGVVRRIGPSRTAIYQRRWPPAGFAQRGRSRAQNPKLHRKAAPPTGAHSIPILQECGGHVTVSTSLVEPKHQRNHMVDSMSQYGATTIPCSVWQ
jgi:hypothetical protein